MPFAITIPVGDTAKPITGTLTFTDPTTLQEVPQNLTGATLQFRLKASESLAVAISVAASISGDPLLGRYEVSGALRALWAAGDYVAEMVVTYADSSIDIFPSERKAMVLMRERWT